MTPSNPNRQGETPGGPDTIAPVSLPLLTLYPNLRQTGWAVFDARIHRETPMPRLASSGTVGPGLRTKMAPRERISHQLQSLTTIKESWGPSRIVCSWAGGMNWGADGVRQLERDLHRWAGVMGLPIASIPAPEVRTAIAGKPNAPKEALAYSVMSRLNLVGQYRSAAEWEAIAAGYYYLQGPSGETLRAFASH